MVSSPLEGITDVGSAEAEEVVAFVARLGCQIRRGDVRCNSSGKQFGCFRKLLIVMRIDDLALGRRGRREIGYQFVC